MFNTGVIFFLDILNLWLVEVELRYRELTVNFVHFVRMVQCLEFLNGAGEMHPWARVVAAKPDEPSLSPGAHVVEGETGFNYFISLSFMNVLPSCLSVCLVCLVPMEVWRDHQILWNRNYREAVNHCVGAREASVTSSQPSHVKLESNVQSVVI